MKSWISKFWKHMDTFKIVNLYMLPNCFKLPFSFQGWELQLHNDSIFVWYTIWLSARTVQYFGRQEHEYHVSKENSNYKHSRLLLVSFPLETAKTFSFKSQVPRKGRDNQLYLSQIKFQELLCELERYIRLASSAPYSVLSSWNLPIPKDRQLNMVNFVFLC